MSVFHVRCHVGHANVDATTVPPLVLNGLPIEEYFSLESKASANAPAAIEMSLLAAVQLKATQGGGVASTDLHWRLGQLTGNSPDAQARRVSNIGLVLADFWRPRDDVFGVMFDDGFDPVETAFNDVPREGCAVFLDPIRRVHGADAAKFARQVCYSAVHELGHVFNLEHVYDEPGSFMRKRTSASQVFAPCRFTDEQRTFLAQASEEWEVARHVRPGGAPFRDRGDLVADAADRKPTRSRRHAQVTLAIKATQKEFYRFEPVELDISVKPTRGRALRLPDEIDPGYGRFVIWIMAPDGSRCRYRPPNYYCGVGAPIPELLAGQPFERDVSVFGGSGGYTFRQAGEHCLQAELRLPNGSIVQSNVETVRVLSALEGRRQYAAFREHLGQRSMARLLYYRAGRVPRPLIEQSRAFVRAHPKTAAAGGVRYAVGRAVLNLANGRAGPEGKRQRAFGLDQLRRALDSAAFGGHRRRNAQEVIAQHEH